MKLRGDTNQPWLFLTIAFPLLVYYVALSVVTAGTCYWVSFVIALATIVLLVILTPVGFIAQRRCDAARTQMVVSPSPLDTIGGCDTEPPRQQQQESRLPQNFFESPINSKVQEERSVNNVVAENGFNNDTSNSGDGLVYLPRELHPSPAAPGLVAEGKPMTFPSLRQSWLQRDPTTAWDEKSFSEKQSHTRSRLQTYNMGIDSGQGESHTKFSFVVQHPANQPHTLLNDEKDGPNPTLEEMRSLARSEVKSRQPGLNSIDSEEARKETPPVVTPSIYPVLMGLEYVSIVCLILLTLLLFIGSFTLAYLTQEGIAAVPVLYASFILVHFVHLFKFVSGEGRSSLQNNCISFLSHSVTFLCTSVVATFLYIAAVVYALTKHWSEPHVWGCNSKMSAGLRAVLYLSPLPFVFAPWLTWGFTAASTTAIRKDAVDEKDAFISSPPSPPQVLPNQGQLNPFYQNQVNGGQLLVQPDDDVDETELSSILLSHSLCTPNMRGNNPSVRSITVHSSETAEHGLVSPQFSTLVGLQTLVKSVTLLYVAYRDTTTISTAARGEGREGRKSRYPNEFQEREALNFQALLNAAKEMESRHGLFVLTAHCDALCFVCGVKPHSVDPILWAVDTATDFFKVFVPPIKGENSYALVAAVLHSPHALVSVVGTSEMSTVHFLGDEHFVGDQLLSRGFALRGLEKQGRSGKHFSTSGVLLDYRAAHLAASRILCRPVGIVPSVPSVSGTGARTATTILSPSSRALLEDFTVIYDFVLRLNEKPEEWHLAAQMREQRSADFMPVVEAAQAFFQGNLTAAKRALENSSNGENDALLQLMSSDVDRIISLSRNSGDTKA